MNYLRGLLFFALLLNKQYLSAQRYPIRTYTLRDGLPQMQVMTTLLDSRGYLWVGTKGGLAKFDGEQFENYTRKDLGLDASYIEGIVEDTNHTIWVATSRGLVRFDGATFTPFPLPDSLDKRTVRLARADEQGKLWLRIGDFPNVHLYQFEQGTYRAVSPTLPGLAGLHIVECQQWDSRQKRLWLTASPTTNVTDARLYYIAKNRCYAVNYTPPAGMNMGFRAVDKTILLEETDNIGHENYRILNDDDTVAPFLQLTNGQGKVVRPAPFDSYFLQNGTGTIFKYAQNTTVLEVIGESPGNTGTCGQQFPLWKIRPL